MILAAGLGSRLRPLTDRRPKALVEVGGKPLLEWAIRKLFSHGFTNILLNVHHFPDQIRSFVTGFSLPGLSLQISDESDLLLDTGGGLKKASWFFDDASPFLVYNVDVLTDLDLGALLNFHLRHTPLATLAVQTRSSSRALLWEADQLVGWRNTQTGDTRWSIPNPSPDAVERAFSGIQIVDPTLFPWFPDTEVFSLIDVYLAAAGEGPILGFTHDDSQWMDCGKWKDLPLAEELVSRWI